MTYTKNDGNTSTYSNEFFNNEWRIYQKVLNNNYLRHQEIYSTLHKLLVDYFQKSFSMLDLGCGDSTFITQAVFNTTIIEYQGVDLSESALEIANFNMASVDCEKNFIQGDFLEVVPELLNKRKHGFDIIIASYTLHHLSLEQKDIIIGQLASLLQTDGVFILIDIVRRKKEVLEVFMKRYLEGIRKYWSLLTPQEYLMTENHISSQDFPETQETLYEISRKHNFTRAECLYCDPLDVIQLLCFYR